MSLKRVRLELVCGVAALVGSAACGEEIVEVRLPHVDDGVDRCIGIPCAAAGPCQLPGTCDPATGECVYAPAADGTACDDGNACTVGEQCRAGTCGGGTARTCPALDPCHDSGSCDPASGCTNPAKPDATICDDLNPCTTSDGCSAGVCTGVEVACMAPVECYAPGVCNPASGSCEYDRLADGSECEPPGSNEELGLCMTGACLSGECMAVPKTCPAVDQCHEAGACNPSTGECSTPLSVDGKGCQDGNVCTETDFCGSGTCQPGAAVVCVTTAACRVAGACVPGVGCVDEIADDDTACDDDNVCTLVDICRSGLCTGTQGTVCVASDSCHRAGVCDPLTGQCSNPAKSDGVVCDDFDACTAGTTCQQGACSGGTPVVSPPGPCEEAGACDPVTGWSHPPKPDGTTCDDGDLCTRTDLCSSGLCVGSDPVLCSPLTECHATSGCNPETGLCFQEPLSSIPCSDDGSLCTTAQICNGGICQGTTTIDCSHAPCLSIASCDGSSGTCVGTPAGDNTACDDGDPCTSASSCVAGSCVPGAAVTCAPLDACHVAGVCDSATGACTNPPQYSGAACGQGVCFADATHAWSLSFAGAESSPIGAAGVAALDYDGDGHTDLALAAEGAGFALLRNLQNTGLEDVTTAAGLPRTLGTDSTPSGVVSADYDNDGHPDLLLLTSGRNRLYRNAGDGTFLDVTVSAGLAEAAWSTSATFTDFNHDGWLDLYVGNYVSGYVAPRYLPAPNHLYRSDGDGTFTEVSSAYGVAGTGLTLAALFSDVNGDTWADLLICNDVMMAGDQGNLLYLNQGATSPTTPGNWFVESAASWNAALSMRCRGIAAADYDNDGRLDYYFANIGANVLLHNEGSSFTDVATAAGVTLDHDVCDVSTTTASWGGGWGDFDRDGSWDLYVSNGFVAIPGVVVAQHSANALLKNGGASFTDVAASAGAADSRRARGAILVDLDEDAALDVVQTNTNGSALFLHNVTGTAGGWVRLTLTGRRSNRDGRGARASLTAGGTTRNTEIGSSNGFASSGPVSAVFGLGAETHGDLTVRWPRGGTLQRQFDVQAGTSLSLVETIVTPGVVSFTPASVDGGDTVNVTSTLTNPTAAAVAVTCHAEMHLDGSVIATGSNVAANVPASGTRAVTASVTVPSAAAGLTVRLVLVVTESSARTEAMTTVAVNNP